MHLLLLAHFGDIMAFLNNKITFSVFQAKISKLLGYTGFPASLFFKGHRGVQHVHQRQGRVKGTG